MLLGRSHHLSTDPDELCPHVSCLWPAVDLTDIHESGINNRTYYISTILTLSLTLCWLLKLCNKHLTHHMADTMVWWAPRVLKDNPNAWPSGWNGLWITQNERREASLCRQRTRQPVRVSVMPADWRILFWKLSDLCSLPTSLKHRGMQRHYICVLFTL